MTDAGTIVGLVARLGGTNPRLDGFSLADDAAAQRRATLAALENARKSAAALAEGTGVRLGPIAFVSDGYRNFTPDIAVAAQPAGEVPPPPPPPPPIAIDLKPRPIETRAQVTVVYEIAR